MKTARKAVLAFLAIVLAGAVIGFAGAGERYVMNSSSGTVLDTKTHLMWAAKDNGSDISWTNAKAYCENFSGGGYRDWRMPTAAELATLYDAGKTGKAPCAGNFEIHVVTEAIGITCFAAWTSEAKGHDAVQFSFVYGAASPYLQSHTYATRALPVRASK